MAFQTPITIQEAITNIERRRYLLPAIQREFVWNLNQIETLFDSLMRDYPIGSFLFWHVEKEKVSDFKFYEFIRDYHEFNATHNKRANVSEDESLTAILDGQQRLTALLMGLKGSYSSKMKYARKGDISAYPKKRLYVNLVSTVKDGDKKWDFKFLTDEGASVKHRKQYWFCVGDVLNFDSEYDISVYLLDQKFIADQQDEGRKLANKILHMLYAVITKKQAINYFLEKDESLDKVLNIFIRVNSGGTQLSYSDLLLSIATAQWRKSDAREEILNFVDEIRGYGSGFAFDKDFVLKSCLVLCDFTEIAFKVDDFNRENMERIEDEWSKITDSLRLAILTVVSFGFTNETLTSKNALIPIAYYLHKMDNPKSFPDSSKYREDRECIRQWLLRSLLKRTFSGQPDNVLRPTRQVIKESENGFPLAALIERSRGGTKSLAFDDDDYEKLLDLKYGKPYTFSTLALLFPAVDFRNKFHVDHIFPRSKLKPGNLQKEGFTVEDAQEFHEMVDMLPNLQLLEGSENIEKSDKYPEEWEQQRYSSEEGRRLYRQGNCIPDMELNIDNFELFMRQRRALLKSVLIEAVEGNQRSREPKTL